MSILLQGKLHPHIRPISWIDECRSLDQLRVSVATTTEVSHDFPHLT